MREKLIKLLDDYTEQLSVRDIHKADFAERFADYLIASGVTIPVQCKDCKHQADGLCPMENYNVPWDVMSDDASCSFGERKDDG